MFLKQIGYTSDHTIRILNHEKVCGFTWNLLERCHSNFGRPFANNPINVDESVSEYAERKRDQFKEIGKLLSDTKMHFALLQEADFVSYEQQEGEERKTLAEMYDLFRSTLNEKGWDFICDLNTEKVLAYSLKNTRLVTDSEKRLLPYAGKQNTKKFALLCATFDLIGEKGSLSFRCVFGSYHLQYSQDYSKSFELAKQKLIENESVDMIVLGGDANRPPNKDIDSLMVSSVKECTNFYTDYAKYDKSCSFYNVELVDERNDTIKAYDGFSCLSRREAQIVCVHGPHCWTKKKQNDKEIPLLTECFEVGRYIVPTITKN